MARYRHYRNPTEPGICFFATTTILDFVPVFRDPRLADLAIREVVSVHRKHRARLNAFVVMPEHLHFVTTLAPDQDCIFFVGRLKTRLAEAVLPKLTETTRALFNHQRGLNRREFWRPSFRGFQVEGDDVFWQKVEYTHLNPVRRGLVLYPEEYRWSSARLFLRGHWSEERGLSFTLEDLGPDGPAASF
ncbi:MAG: REP-associated tyrosine transposase [Fimbriimonadales bacterium]